MSRKTVDVGDVEYAETVAHAGRRGRHGRHGPVALAVVVAAAIAAAGLVAVTFPSDDGRDPSPPPAGPAPPVGSTALEGPVEVSGTTVGEQRFGTDADEVVAALSARLGEPDVVVPPTRYHRIAGEDGWFEDAGDTLSLRWRYPVASATCWGALCLLFGGDETGDLRLRGWELSEFRRWPPAEVSPDAPATDVRLAETGIRLGDTWKQVHAAYPDTTPGGAEGLSLAVDDTPWPGVFDGVAPWRLSGRWDPAHPDRAPGDAVLTRISGGEGPEPGCC